MLRVTNLRVLAKDRSLPVHPARDGISSSERIGVHVVCPERPGASLDVQFEDIAVDTLSLHRPSAPTGDRKRGDAHLGRIGLRHVAVDAIHAARVVASDVSIVDVTCRQRLDLADARIEGALEIRHSEIETWVVLPGQAGNIWIERCLLGGVSGSAMEVEGGISFERVEVKGPRNRLWITGSRVRGGISFVHCHVVGALSVRDCQAPSVVIEDSRVDGATTLALEAVEVEGVKNVRGAGNSPVVVASRDVFKGPFTLRRGDYARDRLLAHRERPAPAMYALSSRFAGVLLLRLGGPGVLEGCRLEDAADILVRSGAMEASGDSRWPVPQVAWLDLTRCWAGESRIAISGKTGDEELRGVDGLVVDELNVRKMDLRYCRLAKLRAQTLRIGSDVRFRRRQRPPTALWGHRWRRPLALEVADEREMFGVQARGLLRRVRRISRGVDEDGPTYLEHPGYEWTGLRWVTPAVVRQQLMHLAPPEEEEARVAIKEQDEAEQRRDESRVRLLTMPRGERLGQLDREASNAETLASIYQQLSTAFDFQGDAGMSADFYWQHTRWRRKQLGLNKQRERLSRAKKKDSYPLLSSQFGGMSFAWWAMVAYQVPLGAGVRSRAPIWTIAALWLTMLAALSGAAALDKIPTCSSQPAAASTTATSDQNVNRNQTRLGCREEWGGPEIIALAAEFVLPVASANPVVLPQGSLMRVAFYLSHMLAAVLLAFFAFSLRAKLRPRKLTA